MDQTFSEILLADGITYSDVKAVEKNWMDKTTLRIGGHLSIPSFKTYRHKPVSIIQDGVVTPLDEVDIYYPFLSLIKRGVFYDIYYISYRW